VKRQNQRTALAAIALLIPCATFCAASEVAPERASSSGFAWKQTADTLALMHGDHIVWQSNHRRGEGKPCLHPVGLVDGTPLTWFRPADHPWHRAIWFAWKKINGTVYWEEGKDGLSPGRNEVVDVQVNVRDDHSATIAIDLSYHLPDQPPVLREKRLISFSSPTPDGSYIIDWTGAFTAGQEDVVFDRTPIPGEPGGVNYGGYAGLSVRMTAETRNWKATNDRRVADDKCNGRPSRWMNIMGPSSSGKNAAVTILDHPSNLRHPLPWYVTKGMPYYSPAILFRAPYTLPKGESLRLRYRILIEGKAVKDDAERARQLRRTWEAFAGGDN